MTSKDEIRSWLSSPEYRTGLNTPTHMLVITDSYDWSDYPVYVLEGENVHEVVAYYNRKEMQNVTEVYWLGGDIEAQLDLTRSFTYGPEGEA